MSTLAFSEFSADDLERHLPQFGSLLHACVHDGASVGFVMPHEPHESEAFWRNKVLPALRDGALVLLVARDGEAIVGTVQLAHDTMPNQRHRADVRKLLVHPAWRRRGIARALMTTLEARAARLQRSLLTLDTRTGDHAEPLYRALGYREAGVIPGYARATHDPRLETCTFMYKTL